MTTNIKNKFSSLLQNKVFYCASTLLCGILAGTLNGFLGSGGGIILIFAMSILLPEQDTADRFATAVLSILPMSIVSAYMYCVDHGIDLGISAPYFASALFGGFFGAAIMSRIKPRLLKLIFAALMLWAGIRGCIK